MQLSVKSTSSAEMEQPTRALCECLAAMRYQDLPEPVVARTEDLFLDWLASALAGRAANPVKVLEQFAQTMGPPNGRSELLTSRRRSSSFFAAMVNGASSHVVEQDDLHNRSVLHPGTV